MTQDLLEAVNSTKYCLDAFLFVQRGLDYTVRQLHEKPKPTGDDPPLRHVTGRQLCHGLRKYAIQQYGLLARSVLGRWRINRCQDFGEIVFALVDAGLMHKTDDDTIQDFVNVFDFEEAFSPLLQLKENTSQAAAE